MRDFSTLKDTKVRHDLTPEELAKLAAQCKRVERPAPGMTVVQFVPKAPKRTPSKA
jgi:hypothetical protein